MTKSRVFFIILISFVIGVFIRSFFELNQSAYFLILIFSIIFLAVFYKNKRITIVPFILLFFIFGAWHTDNKLKKINYLPLNNIEFRGKGIIEKVSPNNFGQNLIIKSENSPSDKAVISLLIQIPKYPEYSYGDELDIYCIAKKIENRNEEFDYRMYMAKEGVFYSCEKPIIQKIGENKGNIFLGNILRIKRLFENNIRAVIPQPK